MKIKKVLPIVLAVLGVILVASLILTNMFSGQDDSVICEGISINGIEVGGMTPEEAKGVVEDYVAELQNRELTIQVDAEQIVTTIGNLGYGCNVDAAIEKAFAMGKTGGFLNRYREQKAIAADGVDIAMEGAVDEAALRNFLEAEGTKYDVEPENANLTRENGVFVVTEHKNGRKLSVNDTMELVKSYMLVEGMQTDNTLLIEAVVLDVEPQYTAETVGLCADVLGTFTTSYTTSSASRSGNVANGARLINGSVVWPGETFSAGGTMNPITAANGYYMAGAYENGQVVESIGGGVCQVSTTLYNAALLAELEIVERSNHSMIVSYVQPSMDAAIAGTYKDLKIKNNTDAPIYIEGVTANKRITFTIYGHETRPTNRTIKYESEVLQVIDPGEEKVTEDPTQPTTYRKVTQSAHVGYKAQLWKVVYEDGKQISREKVNYSSYAPEPAYVTVGTMEVKEVDKDADKDTGSKDKDKNKDQDKKPVTNTPVTEPENGDVSEEGTEGTGTINPEQDGAAGTEEGSSTPEEGQVG